MSEFPFGATDETEPFPADEESPDGRKRVLVLGGVVGALVLGAGAFLLLGGSAPEEEDYTLALPAPSAEVPVVPEAEAVAVVPAASTEQVGRNPFKARYVEPVAAPVEEDPAPPAPESMPIPQQVQVVVQPAPSETQAPSEYPITFKSVEPKGPAGITYTWVIGGDKLEVFQGQRFGKYGELVVLALESADDGPRAVLQVGDATPVRVKVGETVNVL